MRYEPHISNIKPVDPGLKYDQNYSFLYMRRPLFFKHAQAAVFFTCQARQSMYKKLPGSYVAD